MDLIYKLSGLQACNVTSDVTVTQGNGTEEERDKDIEKDNNSISKDILVSSDIDTVIKMLDCC